MQPPPPPPLSPVPEDSIFISRIPSRSEPSLHQQPHSTPPPSRSGGLGAPHSRHSTGGAGGARGPRVPRRQPPTHPHPRPVSFPPTSAMRASCDLVYDGNGSKESIIASEYLRQVGGEYYGPRIVRGFDLEGGGGRGGGTDTVTVASSMSEEVETRPLYRRTWVIAIYVGIMFTIIALAAALGVVLS
ncbi:hypothetical protein BZA05DRAFT_472082 [Tricharina praecox]|uniref:uncharacterized protein n=1 Tax=Tricharina praecox TaxID=43433 RepID=UPI00221FE1BC|nr:uncharacterized protein BZA05DRAFT_472082 [Tricharina praecox]KAI5855169.1 hypothetical protein BZA05DRAFT_472082 [Tricharina praecox]